MGVDRSINKSSYKTRPLYRSATYSAHPSGYRADGGTVATDIAIKAISDLARLHPVSTVGRLHGDNHMSRTASRRKMRVGGQCAAGPRGKE